MEDHFQGKYEVEFKYRVDELEPFALRLGEMGALPHVLDNHEHDLYFEQAEAGLNSRGISMSLRQMEPSGIKLWIVKGPEHSQCQATRIEDLKTAQNMLQTLGYRVAFEIEKERSLYFFGKFHITLDRLSGLGQFVELAVFCDDEAQLPGLRDELETLAVSLGLTREQREPCSYRQLLGF
ncbi:class IV adenylate cyclase [Dongshaea marina]|uniref:class IV adenylate cyclase n=1 Tax=Dongshaea marina TaxID=2047966 RepID=UPI000D3E32B2|nr:class IV adenylate cyclase [Dongshaea marina]